MENTTENQLAPRALRGRGRVAALKFDIIRAAALRALRGRGRVAAVPAPGPVTVGRVSRGWTVGAVGGPRGGPSATVGAVSRWTWGPDAGGGVTVQAIEAFLRPCRLPTLLLPLYPVAVTPGNGARARR